MAFARTDDASPPRYVSHSSSDPSGLSLAAKARSRDGSSPNTASIALAVRKSGEQGPAGDVGLPGVRPHGDTSCDVPRGSTEIG